MHSVAAVSVLLGTYGILVGAVPAPTPVSVEARAATCTFTSADQARQSKAACTDIVLNGINVPAGTTLDLTGLRTGTTVTFQGTTTFGYREWEGPLISVSGTDITVRGASGHLIDGQGQRWWDGLGGNGGKTKPKFFSAHKMTNSVITNLNVKNTPKHAFSVQANNLVLSFINMDNSEGDSRGGHNTDAFDVGNSDRVTIDNVNIKNQDDCLAINSGTNIVFQNSQCSGGHGISIGSVGGRSNNVVRGVRVLNSSISNSDNGVRIKTVAGATGQVSDVTYSGITLRNIAKYGIIIQQDYTNSGSTGRPTPGVPITGLTLSNVRGSVASSGTNVHVVCASGACSNWRWSGISVTGGKRSSSCQGIPSGSGAAC